MAGTPKFIIADEEGNPEDVTDPIKETPPDPKPTTKTVRRPAPPKLDPAPAKRGRPSKSDIEREVAEEFEALLKMVAMLWALVDEDCAPVLDKQSKAIGDSLAALLAKNPRLLERFKNLTGLGDWGTLFFAVLPVLKAVNKNHIAPGMQKKKPNADSTTV